MAAPEYGARNYGGATVPTTLSSDITGASPSMPVADGSSYPATRFFITIDPGLATEEKIYVASRSGNLFTGLERAEDDTGAQGHTAGAVVVHGWIAQDAREANAMSSVLTGRGGLITRSTATGPQELVAGTDGFPLVANQTKPLGLEYAPLVLTVGLAAFVNGKGALLAGGTAGAPTEVAAGLVNQALIADPAQPAGMGFADIGFGQWTSWVPAFDQSPTGSPMTLTAGYCRYVKRGRTVTAIFNVTFTSTGTAGSALTIALPVVAASPDAISGSAVYQGTDGSVGFCMPYPNGTAGGVTKVGFATVAAVAGLSVLGNNPNVAIPSGAKLRGDITYEAAS